ncbi:MAG: hypothetical protein JWL62_3820 [Hyphomicrobiales bacterium]|nr:hypothetical protein [Hyphomicrobiales bacterium]
MRVGKVTPFILALTLCAISNRGSFGAGSDTSDPEPVGAEQSSLQSEDLLWGSSPRILATLLGSTVEQTSRHFAEGEVVGPEVQLWPLPRETLPSLNPFVDFNLHYTVAKGEAAIVLPLSRRVLKIYREEQGHADAIPKRRGDRRYNATTYPSASEATALQSEITQTVNSLSASSTDAVPNPSPDVNARENAAVSGAPQMQDLRADEPLPLPTAKTPEMAAVTAPEAALLAGSRDVAAPPAPPRLLRGIEPVHSPAEKRSKPEALLGEAAQPGHPRVQNAEVSDSTPFLLDRSQARRKLGDILGTRLFLERAAKLGSLAAKYQLAQTYDARVLASWGVRGVKPDAARAAKLYSEAEPSGTPQNVSVRSDGRRE